MGYLYNLTKILNNSSSLDGLKVLFVVFTYSIMLVFVGCIANYITNYIINNSKLKKYNSNT